jgi:hypothetical protein
MTALPLDEMEQTIITDLMRKVGDDVEAVIDRVLQIAPQPFMPLVLTAATVAMVSVVGEIKRLNENFDPARRMARPQLAMLAALFVGRAITEGNIGHALDAAGADITALKHAGRLPR